MNFGSKEIMLEREIPRIEYMSGACFGRGALPVTTMNQAGPSQQFVSPVTKSTGCAPMSTRKVVPLQAVDLLSTDNKVIKKDVAPDAGPHALHWIANWCVITAGAILTCSAYLHLRRRQQNSGKANKPWDGDSYISLVDDKLLMLSEDGKLYSSALPFSNPCLKCTKQNGKYELEGNPSCCRPTLLCGR